MPTVHKLVAGYMKYKRRKGDLGELIQMFEGGAIK